MMYSAWEAMSLPTTLPSACRTVGEPEQVRPFGFGQAQGPGERGQYLRRRRARPALLKLDEVVHGNSGQPGELSTTEPARTPVRGDGQPELLGAQPVAPSPQRRANVPTALLGRFCGAGRPRFTRLGPANLRQAVTRR
jgi:hypothetical protein